MSLGRNDWFMASLGRGAGPGGGRGVRGGSGIGLLLAEAFEVLELENEVVAAADDQRREAVPFIHDLEVHESRIFFQGLAADADGFGLALGLDRSEERRVGKE